MRKYWLILGFVVMAALFYQLGARQARVEGSAPAASGGQNIPSDRQNPPTPRQKAPTPAGVSEVSYRELPKEVAEVLGDIASDGPYEYPRDGITFQNRERLLPQRDRGYYREFTVRTPGSRDRGARRIVTGGRPPTEWYYTDDHYRSFRFIRDAQEIR